MKQLLRLLGLIVMVLLLYIVYRNSNPNAVSFFNHQQLMQRYLPQCVIALGVGLVIISGGIDLSIGSVLGLSAVSFAVLMENHVHPFAAAAIVLACAPLIGLFHGLLITKLRLQPFLVTLCGLFIYRGLAQCLTWSGRMGSRHVGIGDTPFMEAIDKPFFETIGCLNFLVLKTIPIYVPGLGYLEIIPWGVLLIIAVAAVAAILLHGTVYGRYLYAIGANEQAARYAGIESDRYKIMAYMWSSSMAALGGLLTFLDTPSADPANTGGWYELFAITGAVLGGCSLRGGEGSIPGILLGATLYPLVYKTCNFLGLSSDMHPTILGAALLLGTIIDETMKRRTAGRL